jgi:CheY-like chemotaxis protein
MCADGEQAVAQFKESWEEIDLVILDVIMPKLSGRETFEAMIQINPDVKVVVSTGYTMEGEARAILDVGAVDFLQKPYNKAKLLKMVADVLSGAHSPDPTASRNKTEIDAN